MLLFRGSKVGVANATDSFIFFQQCCKPFEFDNLPQFSQAPLFILLDSTLSTHLSHYCI